MGKYTAKAAGYLFPARSRAAIADAVESMGHERAYSYGGDRYPFCFNVKLWDGWDSDAATLNRAVHFYESDGAFYAMQLRAEWDSAWERHADRASDAIFQRVQESMWHNMAEDYSTFPGNDSGQWEFTLAGRSGGWLCLVRGPMGKLAGRRLEDIAEEIRGADREERMPWADAVALYRGLVCMTRDFSREALTRETRYQLAHIRAEWEEERVRRIREAWESSRADRLQALELARELRGAAGALPPTIAAQTSATRRELLLGARRARRTAWELIGEAPLAWAIGANEPSPEVESAHAIA